jgi:hypothetical protein
MRLVAVAVAVLFAALADSSAGQGARGGRAGGGGGAGALVSMGVANRTPARVIPRVATARAQMEVYLSYGRTDTTARLGYSQLRTMYLGAIRNPFNPILQQGDSIKLTDAQADSIAILNRRFVQAMDPPYTALARYLEALPNDYDADAAWDSVRVTYTRGLDLLATQARALETLLTPAQRAMMPRIIARWYDPACIAKWRAAGPQNTALTC